MCNLSQGIVEKGRAEGMAKGIFDANIGSIRAMVSELHLTVEQAMNVLKIPPNERDRYRAALDV